jgi:hypothetical protein
MSRSRYWRYDVDAGKRTKMSNKTMSDSCACVDDSCLTIELGNIHENDIRCSEVYQALESF